MSQKEARPRVQKIGESVPEEREATPPIFCPHAALDAGLQNRMTCCVFIGSYLLLGCALTLAPMIGVSIFCGSFATSSYGYQSGTCLLKSVISCPMDPSTSQSCIYRVIFNNGTDNTPLQMSSNKIYREFNLTVPCWLRGNVLDQQYDLVETNMVQRYTDNINCIKIGASVTGGLAGLMLICCVLCGLGWCCTGCQVFNFEEARNVR
jgi:hypothetical protein